MPPPPPPLPTVTAAKAAGVAAPLSVPPWQPELTTVSEAPAAVQPLRLPVSKPPLVRLPPVVPPVMVSDTEAVCEVVPVPVMVMLYVPAAALEVVEMVAVEALPPEVML